MIIKSLTHLLLYVFGALPFTWRSRFGAFLGGAFGLLPLRDRQIAQQQLSLFFPDRDTARISRQVFGSLGALALETLNLDPILSRADKCISLAIDIDLPQIVKEKHPVIALTAHVGNWELLAAHMVQIGVPVVTVGRAIRHPFLQQLVESHRARYGIKTIWRGGMSGQKELISNLTKGAAIAGLIDQDTKVNGVMSPFFNVPAATPSSLVELGLRHNARFITAFCFRTSPNHFKMEVKEIKHQNDAQEIIDTYHQRLQHAIEEYPEQWVWFHKRWRTNVEGRRLSFKEYQSYLSELASSSS